MKPRHQIDNGSYIGRLAERAENSAPYSSARPPRWSPAKVAGGSAKADSSPSAPVGCGPFPLVQRPRPAGWHHAPRSAQRLRRTARATDPSPASPARWLARRLPASCQPVARREILRGPARRDFLDGHRRCRFRRASEKRVGPVLLESTPDSSSSSAAPFPHGSRRTSSTARASSAAAPGSSTAPAAAR
jgi:hypothetical protein